MAAILKVLRVAAVDDQVVQHALELGWPDLEDAVTAAAAEMAGCDPIATRDPAGFRSLRTCAVVSPEEAAALLRGAGDYIPWNDAGARDTPIAALDDIPEVVGLPDAILRRD